MVKVIPEASCGQQTGVGFTEMGGGAQSDSMFSDSFCREATSIPEACVTTHSLLLTAAFTVFKDGVEGGVGCEKSHLPGFKFNILMFNHVILAMLAHLGFPRQMTLNGLL